MIPFGDITLITLGKAKPIAPLTIFLSSSKLVEMRSINPFVPPKTLATSLLLRGESSSASLLTHSLTSFPNPFL